jgi:L-ascorbate metabolism protein UlaG (beta-lactamase superfamily)
MRIVWLGHGTVIVELDGTRVLVDPLLRGRVAHLRRHAPPAMPLVGTIDAVLVTHLHHDHLDIPSLRRLGRQVPIVMPRKSAWILRARGFRQLREIGEGETLRVGPLDIIAVHAEHGVGRTLGPRSLPLGFVVSGTERVYLAGDTDLYDGMRGLGKIDAAVIPVAGWGPTLGPGHLDSERAAEAVARVSPAIAIPVHYGTYAPIGAGPPSSDPAHRFAERAAQVAPGSRVVIVEPGGSVEI